MRVFAHRVMAHSDIFVNFCFRFFLLAIFYVAFNIINNYGKDIIIKASLPSPHDHIYIPKNKAIPRTIVLERGDPVIIRAIDALTRDQIKIDDRNSITIIPNRRPAKPITYIVPSAGKSENNI